MGRKPAPPPRPVRNTPVLPPPLIHQKAKQVARQRPRQCPNIECEESDVQDDGTCHSCGCVLDDSNIVAEVTFGESGSGAAVVNGTFVAADQGTATALDGRLAANQGNKQASIRDAKGWMAEWCQRLRIPLNVSEQGHQLYKLASAANFVQGRRIDQVAAVCLYSAHRRHPGGCNTMLIDYADLLGVSCHKLGNTYKNLHREITASRDGVRPVIAEDLMYRFADKLEFGTDKDKVATDAIRISQRMSKDWLDAGRRPSGICGAALIMAARMNNYRRTPTEVTYVVKAHTHTIQKRLDEFKVTPSSTLSINDFLQNEFLEQAHDPPSFYVKQPGFKKKNSRKRKKSADGDEEAAEDLLKRQKTADGTPARRDADGFAIPARPTQSQTQNPIIDPSLTGIVNIDDDTVDEEGLLAAAYANFGDLPTEDDTVDDTADDDISEDPIPHDNHGLDKRFRQIHVPEEWARDEDELIDQITEMVYDPSTTHHALAYARAERRVEAILRLQDDYRPEGEISDDRHIGEDEFAHDWEVNTCILSAKQAKEKEVIWVNSNKGWLRAQQAKEFARKKAENGPPKVQRKRQSKSRIGEDVAQADTPEEAVRMSLDKRGYSKKINPTAMTRGLFDTAGFLQNNQFLGSREASIAPTTADGSDEEDEEDEDEDGEETAAPPRDVRQGSVDSTPDDYVGTTTQADEAEDDDDEAGFEYGDEEEEDEYAMNARLQHERMHGRK